MVIKNMAEATLNSFGVFGDEVYTSTDLNRRAGEVLNRAREHPVTISRNNEQFALFPREQAAKLVRTVNRIGVAVELLGAIHDALSGGTPSISWVRMFEKDDLEKLFAEVLSATRDASIGRCDWDHVAAVIHEWQESALVAKSGVLDTPMHSEFSDESPLPHPAQVKPLDKETELEE
jgi:prevent-host-death family protein